MRWTVVAAVVVAFAGVLLWLAEPTFMGGDGGRVGVVQAWAGLALAGLILAVGLVRQARRRT